MSERAAKLGTKKRPGKRRKTAKNKRVRDTNVRPLFHKEKRSRREEQVEQQSMKQTVSF